MALLELSAVGTRSDDELARMVTEAHRVMVEVLRVPADDPTVLISRVPERYAIMSGNLPEQVIGRVTMFSGRSPETIAHLVQNLKTAITRVGPPPESVFVVVVEAPRSCWSATAGRTAAEVDLGFEVEI